ncbi:swim zinc finger-containing protein [Halogranum salarium B-1]|uniref:Swim zinc finger-containing protein n=1 Tax=Halogranum salarium B-1 TaxID=1210908 RepID=J2ZA45_9EURY|nr:swim zinc finger-containing protein [Halogranum salarium B-1]
MTNAFAHLDTTRRVVKRAQYEAFEFECLNGGIRVRNCSHAEPAKHEYHVAVDVVGHGSGFIIGLVLPQVLINE